MKPRPRPRATPPPMVAAIATTTGGLLPVFLTGALAVQIRSDLALSESALGIAVATFFAASAVSTAGFGRLADRIGGDRVMRLATLPSAAVLLVIAAAVRSWAGLVAALAVAGLMNGAIQPSANQFLTRMVGANRQGFAFGVKQAAIPAAGLLSGLAVPVVAVTVGWRWAFGIAAVLAAAAGRLVPPVPPEPVAPAERAVPAEPGSPAEPATRAGPPEARRAADPPRTVHRPPLVTLGVGLALGSAAVNALGAFFVLSAVDTGVGDSTAGLLAAIGSAASFTARLVLGYRADHREAGHLRTVAIVCACGAAGFVMLATGDRALLLPAALIAYGAGWGWAGLFNFSIAHTHPHAPGRATGITQVGASAGACFGPLSFGFLAEHTGFPLAWGVTTVLIVVSALVIVAGRRQLLGSLAPAGGPGAAGGH